MNFNSEIIHQNLVVGLAAMERGLIDRQQLTKLLTLCSTGPGMSLVEVLKTHKIVDEYSIAGLLRQLESESLAGLQATVGDQPAGDSIDQTAMAEQAPSGLLAEDQTLPPPAKKEFQANKTDVEFPTLVTGMVGDDDSFNFEQSTSADSQLPKRQNSKEKLARQVHLPSEANRFDKIESHAQGGLGVVFVARDKQLDRHVAVKEIRANFVNVQEARERFEFEARVTGGLEHPCVVPVYAFGEHADGVPFYAMRFISGQSLKQAIDRFYGFRKKGNRDVATELDAQSEAVVQRREDASRPVSLNGAAFRNLLIRLVATCNGIAFAHSRGVLHRDLKPANIMLGKYGETLVVDWGLAKYIGSPEDASLTSHLPTGISGSSPSATIAGTTIGTPLFMSPEQAAGKLDELTPASDIYSLGSTLFLIITGKHPYLGNSPKEVIEKVKIGKFIPPRQIKASIPRPLAAICEKAMSLNPSSRYCNALEMADDIERYLAGDPVSAYPEPWHVRIWRWIRHHQTTTTAAAVLLLTTTIGSSVGMGLIGAEQKRTILALQELTVANAKIELARADGNMARAVTRDSISLITDDLVGQILARNNELEATDRKLLKNVLRQFETFTQGDSNSPAAVALRAEGFQRVGDLQRRLGERTESRESYRAAGELINSLLVDHPQQPEYLVTKASVNANTGLLAADQGNYRDSIRQYSAAIETLQELRQDKTVSNSSDLKLAKVLGNRANNHARIGDTQLARADYMAAAGILGQSEYQFQPLWMREAARNRASLASLLSSKLGRHDDAVKEYEAAIHTYNLLATKLSDDLEIQFERASARSNLGVVMAKLKNRTVAESNLRAAFDEAKLLSDTYPGFVKFRRLFAETSTRLAEQLASSAPEQAEFMLRDAKQLLTDLTQRQPSESTFKKDLAITLGVLASLRAAHDLPEATALFEQQLLQWQQLTELDPEEPEWESGRIAAENNYANFLRKSGKFPEAIDHYNEILKYLDAQSQPDPIVLWKVLYGIADSNVQLENYQLALECWERLVAKRDDNWSAFESQRIIGLLRTGQLTEGLSAIEKRLADKPQPRPIDFYDLSCCYAIALEVVQSDQKHGIDPAAVRSLPDKAMEMLGKAAKGGYFKQERRRHWAATDHDLDGLRSLPAFKDFCELHSIKKGADF